MNDAGDLVRDPAARREASHPIGDDAVAIAHNVRSGAVAPSEVVEKFQARIEALNPLPNAIVDYDPAEAHRQAADAGGSARRPPAHVGVVGFKPSRGAIADVNGFPSVAADVDTIAPIARNVADVTALFGVIVGADPRDPCSMPLGPPDVRPSRT